MSEERRSPSDLIHREKTDKSNTAFLRTTGRSKENIYKNDDEGAGTVTAETGDCAITRE